jgi:hypothetical protein
MAYLLDADVFIRAKNLHYGLDFCPVRPLAVVGAGSISAFSSGSWICIAAFLLDPIAVHVDRFQDALGEISLRGVWNCRDSVATIFFRLPAQVGSRQELASSLLLARPDSLRREDFPRRRPMPPSWKSPLDATPAIGYP